MKRIRSAVLHVLHADIMGAATRRMAARQREGGSNTSSADDRSGLRKIQTARAKEKMVNAQVPSAVVKGARPIIEDAGPSISDGIRNTFEYIARTGMISESAKSKPSRNGADFLTFISEILAHPTPGAKEFETKSDKEILGEIRWERYIQKDTAV